MSPPSSPLWKRAFDQLDRTVGARVNDLAASEDFTTLMAVVKRTQLELRRRTERASRRALHLFNLPSASDVNRLLNQIGSLEREVRDLRKRLADEDHEGR